MPAYWLTYKPLSAASPRGWPAEDITDLVRRFQLDPMDATPSWRIAAHQAARIGDRVFIFKQGADPRGIFGVGEIIEAPTLQSDPIDIDEGPRQRAKIRFDRLVDPAQEFLIDLNQIDEILPENLIAAQASGVRVPDEVTMELEKRLFPASLRSDQADDLAFDPDSVKDERERAIRAIRLRRGQPAFRAALLSAYGGRCAITGCSVKDVLEAAHITPYLGSLTNHVSNGLLLRTDLHTLFDCGLIAIEPRTRTVAIAEALKTSSYIKLVGKSLRQPNEKTSAPSRRNLEKRYALFEVMRAPRDKLV